MTHLSRLERLLAAALECAPSSDRWAADCRAALAKSGWAADRGFFRRCLGAAFRRAAAADRGWFLAITLTAGPDAPAAIRRCRLTAMELLAAAAWITPESPKPTVLEIHGLGARPLVLGPGARGWRDWIEAVATAEGLAFATGLSDRERRPAPAKPAPAAEAIPAVAPAAAAVPASPPTIFIQPQSPRRARKQFVTPGGGLF